MEQAQALIRRSLPTLYSDLPSETRKMGPFIQVHYTDGKNSSIGENV